MCLSVYVLFAFCLNRGQKSDFDIVDVVWFDVHFSFV